MEPKDLLAPTATLFAVLFAIASFLILRCLALIRERITAMNEIDVPQEIKRKAGYKFGISADILLTFSTGILTLILGVYYCPELLYKVTSFYLGSPTIYEENILYDFRDMVDTLRWFSYFIIVTVFVLFANDIFINPRLPLIVRFYAGNVLGQRLVKKEEAGNLYPEAKKLYEKGAFSEAVLYSLASLETALKNKLSLPNDIGFSRVIIMSAELLGKVVPSEKLVYVRKLRNAVAHPSPDRKVTKAEAGEVIKVVGDILKYLEENP